MTDEVFSDNLDEASKADTEAAAAVEALPAEGEAVQAVAADQATDEQAQSEQDAPEEPRKPLRMKTLSRMPVPRPSRNSPRACARLKASGMCCTPIPAMRSA